MTPISTFYEFVKNLVHPEKIVPYEDTKKAVNLLNGLTAPENGTCHKTVTLPTVRVTATG